MSLLKAKTPKFYDEQGKVLPNSIAEMKMVDIGDVKQSIIIRGINIDNPVLLLVHGGPGSAETPLFRHFNSELEKHFVVIYWDQRGCGRSYNKKTADAELTVYLYVRDLCDLAKHLRGYLDKDKIYLFAHSWGTLISMLAIAKCPELFHAYVGTGQVSDMPESESESYDFVLDIAKEKRNRKALRELSGIGRPVNGVYDSGILGTRIQRKWLNRFGGSVFGAKGMGKYIIRFFRCPEYSIKDVVKFFKAMNAPSRNKLSQTEFLHYNLFDEVKNIEIPIILFLGRHDHQVSAQLAKKYFDLLEAPSKKIIWFENSAHNACFEEAEKFNASLVDTLLKQAL